MMTWTRPDNDCGQITAHGNRGAYTIRSVGSLGYTLTGLGHDDLPMMQLPPYGRLFETLDAAKDYASGLERVAAEGQVSGC